MTLEEILRVADAAVFAKTGRHLSDAERTVLQGAYLAQTYEEIAATSSYSVSYLKRDVGPKFWRLLKDTLSEPVSKTNFRAALERWSRGAGEQGSGGAGENLTQHSPLSTHHCDWGEAVDVSVFYGRAEELALLERWIVRERCRVVVLLGMGGIGKTAVSVKLAQQIQSEFEFLIWRSLRNAPPLLDLLGDLVQFLSNHQQIELPRTISGRISRLVAILRANRCLVVLDNAETILSSGERTGQYREGYEGYGELLRQVGEMPHHSCLVLTSREKPREIVSLEGTTLPVRSLYLSGLKQEAQALFAAKGIVGSEQEKQSLIESYSGNPLALKIVSTSIQDLFNGKIAYFLAQDTTVFNGIRNLLNPQFERLSKLEEQLMYWLAINREGVSLSELQSDIIPFTSKPKLLEALESLVWRSLIEHLPSREEMGSAGFTQQPVVMEYVTERLIDQVYEEIVTGKLELFLNLALVKATTKSYIRESQIRVILEPLAARICTILSFKEDVEHKLQQLLLKMKTEFSTSTGYGGGNIINLLHYLKINLAGYDFSHLPVWQAYLQNVDLPQVNFAYSDLAKSVFTQTLSSIFSIAFSPDGELLATGDDNGEVLLWRVADGQKLLTCRGHTDWVRSVAFSPDGQIIASGSEDQSVRLWDIATGQCLKILQQHTNWVLSIAFSPEGKTIASGSQDHTVRLWDTSTGECKSILRGHTNWVLSVVFSPDGQKIASGSGDHTVRLWDTSTGECTILQGHTKWVMSVVFSPESNTLASGSEDHTVRIWDVQTGQCLKVLQGHTGQTLSVAFSPGGTTLASGSGDHTVKLWDISTGQCLKTLQGHVNRVRSVAFSPGGTTLASGSGDQAVKIWDVREGKCLKTLQGHSNWVWSIAFSPGGKTIASGNTDKTVKLWDVETGECIGNWQGHSHWVCSVAFSPGGSILASGSGDATVRLWDVSTGQCLKTLQGHANSVRSVVFCPEGKTLASASEDQTVKLWDISTGQCLKTLQGHTNWVRSVAISPEDNILASGSLDKTVKLWDISTGQCLKTLEGHTDSVRSVVFSPDGQILASGGGDETIRIWDVREGKCLKILHEATSQVWSVVFSPDSHTLASGSTTRSVKLWDVREGNCLKTFQGHTSQVWSVIFSLDGKMASGSQDETIKLWDINTGECLKTLRADKPYQGMNITGVTGLSETTIPTLKALGAVEI